MSLTETEQSAAADLTAAILTTAARNGDEHAANLLGMEGASVEVVEAVLPAPSIPTPAAPAATETPAPPEAPAEAPAAVTYEPVLSDELAALLAEPDFEEEAAAEIAAEAEETYIEDPAAAATDRAKDKRIKFLEGQLTERSRKNWVLENLRAYPLLRDYAKSEVEGIQATSRRAFAREAAAMNTRLETIAAPMLTDLRAAAAQVTAETRAETRTEVKRAWGDPGPDFRGGAGDADHDARLAAAENEAQRTGDVSGVFREMLTVTNPLK